MVRQVRAIWALLPILAAIDPGCLAESKSGSLCIAPAIFDPKDASAPGLYCKAEDFSLKIDAQALPWPVKEGAKLTGLDLNARHKVIVFCGHKPQQSFSFRFSEFQTKELCLFLNDLYRTVQLSEAKRSPWCRCK
jgi:hypothetical protein